MMIGLLYDDDIDEDTMTDNVVITCHFTFSSNNSAHKSVIHSNVMTLIALSSHL